jgi:hypothetical protein
MASRIRNSISRSHLDNAALAILAVLVITLVGVAIAPKTEVVGIISYCVTAIAGLASGKALSK